jgi:tetratricopeptide (TPR) repeat protein
MVYVWLLWSVIAAPAAVVRSGDTAVVDKAARATMTAELRRGRQLASQGQHAEAVAAFDAALRAVPDEPRVLLELGWELRAAGNLPRAEEICRRAVQMSTTDPDRAKALYNLGRVLESKGDKPNAIVAYRDSLRLRENKTVRERLIALGVKPDPPKAEPPKIDDSEKCAEACTEIAACWEEVHGGDYRGGGACTDRCGELEPPGRKQFYRCLERAKNCKATLKCE